MYLNMILIHLSLLTFFSSIVSSIFKSVYSPVLSDCYILPVSLKVDLTAGDFETHKAAINPILCQSEAVSESDGIDYLMSIRRCTHIWPNDHYVPELYSISSPELRTP